MVRDLSIAYLVQQFLPEIGAGPARASELSRRWHRMGARVTVVTAMPNRPQGVIRPEYRGRMFAEEDWEGIRVLRSWLFTSPRGSILTTLLNNSTFAVSSAVHATRKLPDADVLIASSPPFFPHLAGAYLKSRRDVPLVLELRDLWPDYLSEMGMIGGVALGQLYRLERWLLERADAVVVVTPAFKQRVVDKGVPADIVHVMPNGVDSGLYYRERDPQPLPGMRKVNGDFVVGYLGNFGRCQQLESVVEAAGILAEQDPSIRVVLTGDGPRRTYVEAAARRTPQARISLHRPIRKDQTRAFYNSMDACLVPLAPYPAMQATIPSKLFEIMACETPVVASLAGEGKRVVEDSQAGLVAGPGSAEDIAETILRLKRTRPRERADMGARGRAYVRHHYCRDEIAAEYHRLLGRLARESRSGRRRGS